MSRSTAVEQTFELLLELMARSNPTREDRVLAALIFAARELVPEGAAVESMSVSIQTTHGRVLHLGPITRTTP